MKNSLGMTILRAKAHSAWHEGFTQPGRLRSYLHTCARHIDVCTNDRVEWDAACEEFEFEFGFLNCVRNGDDGIKGVV